MLIRWDEEKRQSVLDLKSCYDCRIVKINAQMILSNIG